MEQQLSFEHRLTQCEQQNKSNTRRMEELEKRQADLEALASGLASMAAKQEHMEGDVKEIKADVKALTARPGKRWEGLADKTLWAVWAAVVAFLLGRLGL